METAGVVSGTEVPVAFPASGWVGKRAFDLTVALVLLILLLPLLVVTALAVKLTSRGPVLFRQARVGLGGRQFRILKFRTMVPGAEQHLLRDPRLHAAYVDGDHKLPNRQDPRVTPVGRVLRAVSLDELPQLLNVVAGHMSLVGPRPVVPSELERFGEHKAAYTSLRPGVTGLWQVSGRNHIRYPERAALEADYARRCSAALDLELLLRTPGAVLFCRGSR